MPVTSLMSSRTIFDLFEVCYIIKSSPTATYSLLAVAHLLLQLLGLETLLSSASNAFPRSLHGDCRFSVLDNSKLVGVYIPLSQFPNTLFDQGGIFKFNSFELYDRAKCENECEIELGIESYKKVIRCSMLFKFHPLLIFHLFCTDYTTVYIFHFFSIHYGETKLIQE